MKKSALTPAETRALTLERHWALTTDGVSGRRSSAPKEYRDEMRRTIAKPEAEEHAPGVVRWLRRRVEENDAAEFEEARENARAARFLGTIASVIAFSGASVAVAAEYGGVLVNLATAGSTVV